MASEIPHHAKHHASVLVCKDAQLGDSNARNNMSLGEGRSWYRPLLLPLLSGWAWRDKKEKVARAIAPTTFWCPR